MKKQFRVSVLATLALMTSLTALTSYSPAQSAAPAPASTSVASKPNFNGSWKLNQAKSEFNPAPMPKLQTEVLTVAGDDLTIVFTSDGDDGKQKSTSILKLGGPEAPSAKPELNETPLTVISSKAEWKGDAIVITEQITYQGGPGSMALTYTLSPDGQTLTKAMSVSLDMGQYELKAVYDRN